jgi:hypothetical protein
MEKPKLIRKEPKQPKNSKPRNPRKEPITLRKVLSNLRKNQGDSKYINRSQYD